MNSVARFTGLIIADVSYRRSHEVQVVLYSINIADSTISLSPQYLTIVCTI